ncbi:MAG: CoA ester lyase [Xenophilus sp.]
MASLPVTYLFVPGDRPERFAKAFASDADMVVMDLEDAVAPNAKDQARAFVSEALSRNDGERACVRINGTETTWFDNDCRLLGLPGLAAVMLPKAESTEALQLLARRVPGLPVIPVIETARGLEQSAALAASTGVHRLAFGSVDFQLDLGIEGDDVELLHARSRLVLASRLAHAAPPIDGVTLAVHDPDQARCDAVRARRLGFGAKLCIHPAQIGPVKVGFAPDAQQVAWATGVLAAFEAHAGGVLAYEGKLVDRPVVERARSILART